MWWERGCERGKLGSLNARRVKLARYVRRALACGPRSRRGRKKLQAAIARAVCAAFDLIEAQMADRVRRVEQRADLLTFKSFAATVQGAE